MSYLTFHFVFILPPILLLLLLQRRPLAGVGGWRGAYSIPLICTIAFCYTIPWDNYLVYRDVWGYGPDRVLATIGYVPVEEYLFFLLQPILTGLFIYWLLQRSVDSFSSGSVLLQRIGFMFWFAITAIGIGLIAWGQPDGLYLGLILAWAAPVIALMWLYAGDVFASMPRLHLVGIGIPTIYLWFADAFAIRNGIWHISEQYTVGLNPFGLPIEEATFFLVTNILIVHGLVLFLYGDRIAETRPPGSIAHRLQQFS